METNSKANENPKDTQVKPIVERNEQVNEQTLDPLQDSKLYPEDNKALLDHNGRQEQSTKKQSDGMNRAKVADEDNEETARGKEKHKAKEKSKIKVKKESPAEKTYNELLRIENENRGFGNFTLYSEGGCFFQETIIRHKEFIIAADQEGNFHFRSDEFKYHCTF